MVRRKGVISKGPGCRGEVNSAFNTIVDKVEHLDGDYTLDVREENKTTNQGWLVVGRLDPKTSSLPRFSFRWDEKGKHVNVDIDGVGKTERNLFECGKNGYSGHEAQRVNQASRLFVIDIFIPSKHVFKGRIRFNLSFSEELIQKINVAEGVNYTLHSRGEPPSHTA
jgi:hypothetical protein